jgi:acyl-CoA dehydrogenase
MSGGSRQPITNPDSKIWLDRMASKGWTVPNWPVEYGGAGLDIDRYLILLEEMSRIHARPPLEGMGVTMLGPTLLEYGTEEQKLEHLPRIASGEVRWCQGYSEPNAGSDLASLATRAEDQGDHYIINGSKIWTTLAQYADWMFCLVRTEPQAPKHEGISFVLFSMDQPGVSVTPIQLISGSSPFCEVFFDNVVVSKSNVVHRVNQGWTVAKRLLQHERSGIQQLASESKTGSKETESGLVTAARECIGLVDGRLADAALRDAILCQQMNDQAFKLTQRRVVEESNEGKTPGAATSFFKLYAANLTKEQLELLLKVRGTNAFGWEGEGFRDHELWLTRTWLGSKAMSIAGGTNEVQLNIVAKRVLGLPD